MIEFHMALPYLFASGLLVVLSIFLFGFLPFPTGITIFVLFSQFMFALVASEHYEYVFLSTFGNGGTFVNFHKTMAIYLLISFLSAISFHGGGMKVRDATKRFSNSLALNKKHFSFIIQLGAIIYIVIFCLSMASLDFDSIVYNTEYLSIKTNAAFVGIIGSELSNILIRTIGLSAILGTVIAMAGIWIRIAWIRYFICFILCLHFVYLLSANSRSAAFIPIMVAVCIIFMDFKNKFTLIVISLFLAIYALLNGLVGRGSPVQGLAGLPSTLMSIIKGNNDVSILTLLLNFSEGIFVIAEGESVRPVFNQLYSWLSLSPFPSFIDGFSEIQRLYEIRLSDYVPMAGVTEVINFGSIHVVICLSIIYILVRLHLIASERNTIVFALANFLIFFAIYNACAYSLRTAMHSIWLSYYFTVFSLVSSTFSPPAARTRLHESPMLRSGASFRNGEAAQHVAAFDD